MSSAVAYTRVSTTADRQELGLAAQRVAIEAWAGREGITIVAWHEETVSGGAALADRPVLLAALAEVAARGVQHLVVHRIDRFSREPMSAILAESELQRAGASLAVADGAGGGNDPTSELVRSMLLAVAKFEKSMIRARITAALAVKKSRGEVTGAPRYGYKRDRAVGANGAALAVVDEREQAVLAAARELRAEGRTVRGIVSALAERGMVARSGKPFSVAAVHAMVAA